MHPYGDDAHTHRALRGTTPFARADRRGPLVSAAVSGRTRRFYWGSRRPGPRARSSGRLPGDGRIVAAQPQSAATYCPALQPVPPVGGGATRASPEPADDAAREV